MIKRFSLENILGIAPRKLKKKSHTLHFKKKHIQNIRKQEKNRIKEIILERVNSWIKKEQTSLSSESLKYYLRCLKELSDQNGYSFNEDLLLPTVIYADRFIKKQGEMDKDCIFSLLLVSSLVATKFWQDTGIDLGFTSEFLGIPKKELGDMERQFLLELNYDLYLTEKDLDAFRAGATLALSS